MLKRLVAGDPVQFTQNSISVHFSFESPLHNFVDLSASVLLYILLQDTLQHRRQSHCGEFFIAVFDDALQDGLSVVSEARVAGEDLQGRHKRRKNKEERMKSVLEGQYAFCMCVCQHVHFVSAM